MISIFLVVVAAVGYWVWWAWTHPPDAKLEWIAGSWYIGATILFVAIMLGLVWLIKWGW